MPKPVIDFIVKGVSGQREISLTVQSLICCGYAGRDQDAVRKHVEELKELGVAPPNKTPTAYLVPTYLATTDDYIEVFHQQTSGEAEYVVLVDEKGELYVTVGSDHTDREVERVSVERSKQIYPKIMAREVWLYREVEKHWDEIQLRCWVTSDEGRLLSQEAPLSALLPVAQILSFVEEEVGGKLVSGIVFSGTIPTLSGKLVFGRAYELQLHNPATKNTIEHRYYVKTVMAKSKR